MSDSPATAFSVQVFDHPLLQNFNHPFFTKLLTFTDQVVFIVNYATTEFLHVSANVVHVLGIAAQEYKKNGLTFLFERLHPDDLRALNDLVFPEYDRCFDALPPRDKIRFKSTFTARLRKADGTYIRLLQQNIPLTLEDGKPHLGLIVTLDISPYKKDDHVTYKNVIVDPSGNVHVLAEGMHHPDTNLSKREITILRLTANGLSEKQIGERLSLSIYTVKSHRKNMMKKTGVKNAAELVRFGMANFIL